MLKGLSFRKAENHCNRATGDSDKERRRYGRGRLCVDVAPTDGA